MCAVDDIPDGGAFALDVRRDGEAEALLLLRRGDRVLGFHNLCPHAGRRLDWAPGRFLFDLGLLVCAAHGASFEVPEGRCVAGPCRGQSLLPVEIRVHEGAVYRV